MTNIEAILVPVDFSEPSRHAFAMADSLAQDHGARLVVLHVLLSPPFVSMGEMKRGLQDPAGYRAEVLEKLHQYQSSRHETAVEYQVIFGDPIEEIVRAAGECKCDVIVMATHGRTGVRRLLMGSIAEGVLRRAPCKVITIAEPAPSVEPPAIADVRTHESESALVAGGLQHRH